MRYFVVALLCALPTVSFASTVVDQENVPAPATSWLNAGNSNQVDQAQTFLVGHTGQLTGFDIWVDRTADVTLPLLYDIRLTEAGLPTSDDAGPNVLSSGSLDANLFSVGTFGLTTTPPDNLLHVDLPTPIEVQAGELLALVLRSDDPAGSSYIVHGDQDNTYPNGYHYVRSGTPETWRFFSGTSGDIDLVFRTYIQVPEPTSCWIFAAGLAGIVASKRFSSRFSIKR